MGGVLVVLAPEGAADVGGLRVEFVGEVVAVHKHHAIVQFVRLQAPFVVLVDEHLETLDAHFGDLNYNIKLSGKIKQLSIRAE